MPQRQHKPFTFTSGSQIEIWQPSWDMSMELREIEDLARAEKAKQNGSGNPDFFYFYEQIYAPLAACSEGDVPTAESAFTLSPPDLDGWYQVARQVYPRWFESGELTERVVTFSDGSTLTVLSKRPSVLLRRFQLEQEVDRGEPLESIKKEAFRVNYYPKLAGCSIGDVPTMEVARTQWGEDDLQAWYDGAVQVIPEWFLHLEEIVERNQRAAEALERKKKRRRSK